MTATAEPPSHPSTTDGLAQAGRGSALNLAGAAFSALANVLVLVLLTRGFGKTEAGVIFAATSIFLVLESLGRVGADVSLVYFLPRQRRLHGAVLPGTVRHALLPVTALTIGMGAALFLLAAPAAELIGADGAHTETYLRILALFVPAASLTNVALGASRGFGTMLPTVVLERFGRSAAQVLLVLTGVLLGSGTIAVFGWAAPFVPAAVLALWWLRRALERYATASAALSAAEFWRFTAPRALAAVSQVILQRLDIILVAALRSPGEAAVYAAATRFLVVGQLGVQALSHAVQPPLSSALAVGDKQLAGMLYQMSTGWLVLLVWPLFFLCLSFSIEVLAVFGDGYSEGQSVMVVLALTMLVATGCGFVDVVLIMAGRSSWSLMNTTVALIVNLVLNLLLIPPLGILGAALGWASAILINNLVPLVQVRRSTGLHPLGRGVIVAMLAATALFGALLGSAVLLTDSAAVGLVAVLLACVAYAGLAWWRRDDLNLERLVTSTKGRSA